MTEQEVQEIRAFLRSKGFSDDAIKSAFLVAKEEECIISIDMSTLNPAWWTFYEAK